MSDILVVEDDEHLNRLFVKILSHVGFNMSQARSIQEALLYLENTVPKAVLLDLALPDGHGLTLLQEIRNKPALQDVIVILATGETQFQNIAGIEEADYFVLKPVAPATLQELMKRLTQPEHRTSGLVPVKLELVANRRVLLMSCAETWEVADMQIQYPQIVTYLDQATQPIHVIISFQNSDHIPGRFFQVRENAASIFAHENLGHIVVVATSLTLRKLFEALARMIRFQNIEFTNTLDQAWALINPVIAPQNHNTDTL